MIRKHQSIDAYHALILIEYEIYFHIKMYGIWGKVAPPIHTRGRANFSKPKEERFAVILISVGN